MKYRRLGKTGFEVSEIGFGAWAIGSHWGKQSDDDSHEALNTAIDKGVNFIDTAFVYGQGKRKFYGSAGSSFLRIQPSIS